MGVEIERKFRVEHDEWRAAADEGRRCVQGYLLSDRDRTVRVRRIGEQAFLTIKGPADGPVRPEFEYEIPVDDAEALMALCGPVVEKTRYRVLHNGLIWEVDLFSGRNEGLTLAEVELENADQTVNLPEWIGEEVTGQARFYNACLAEHPYVEWSREEKEFE